MPMKFGGTISDGLTNRSYYILWIQLLIFSSVALLQLLDIYTVQAFLACFDGQLTFDPTPNK